MTLLVGLVTIAVMIFYFSYETWALATNHTTLSRMVWRANKAWPPLPFVVGLLIGGLAVHFLWFWCPQ